MTTLTLSNARPLFAGFAEIFEGLANGYRLHRQYLKTLDELQNLSARELADLGEGHMTPEAMAFKAVYGDNA